jgi:hypothetical protein
MDTNWKHQKDAITTDQKNRIDDEHIHEIDKRHLKESESESEADLIPKQEETRAPPKRNGLNANAPQ